MEIHRFNSQIIGGEPKLFVPAHVRAELEADQRQRQRQAEFLRQRFEARNAGVRQLVGEGYRVEELQLEELPSRTGDPLLSTFRVMPRTPKHPIVRWFRRQWREHIVAYDFATAEGEDCGE